ncbi:LssY C-terminal domain-containing protein [Micropruina sp.]|uniref:LssY C-terminal domain-containing protein n=1 Tax=Micropruina sp. TaxID=2737536 RepID=UPI0039E410D4
MHSLELRRRSPWVAMLDTVLFVLAGLASVWLAYQTPGDGIQPGWPLLLGVVIWVLVPYLVLPRMHRILSRVHVPDYFIGRTRTALLGEPVNLALRGSADQVRQAMVAAGWRIVVDALRRRSYPNAPVSALVLFGRAYQRQARQARPAKIQRLVGKCCSTRPLLVELRRNP